MINFGKFLIVFFGVMMVLTASVGLYMTTNSLTVEKSVSDSVFNADKPVTYTELGSSSSNPTKLKAMVKGSIYETGSNMTVYGACFDGDGYLISASTATFNSWYPTGSAWQQNATMEAILDGASPTGRFLIHVDMGSTIGTYLTEITCHYAGDTAIAFGEWQNPEWVVRLKTIEDYVTVINDTTIAIYDKVDNISYYLQNNTVTIMNAIADLKSVTSEQYGNLTVQITNFDNKVQSNFSHAYDLISAINGSISNIDLSSLQKEHAALYDLVHAIDYSFWILDIKDTYYSGGTPNAYDFQACDMSSPDNFWAVTDSGDAVYYNGTEYNLLSISGYNWTGVSAIEANTNYAWIVGTNGSACYYSINGAAPVEMVETVATSCEDIVTFFSPSLLQAYTIANNGDILFYNGTVWSIVNNTGESGAAKIGSLPDGSTFFFVQGDKLTVLAGGVFSEHTVPGAVLADVSAIYSNLAYMISSEVPYKVYKYDGTAVVTTAYTATGSTATPTAIAAHNSMDIWVTTNVPGSYYHYDGKQWSFAEYPYSNFVGIVIGFNASAAMSMNDIAMFSEKDGYTCGDDGLLMIYQDKFDKRFDSLDSQLTTLTSNVAVLQQNMTQVITTVNQMSSVLQAMNLSIMTEFSNLNAYLVAMNASLQLRFDAVDAYLSAMNVSIVSNFNQVYSQLSDLNYTVNLRFDTVDLDIFNLNQTVVSNFDQVFARFTAVDNNLTYIQSQINGIDAAMSANFTYVIGLLQLLDVNMYNNFTYTNGLISAGFGNVYGYIDTNFTYTNLQISNMQSSINTGFGNVYNYIGSNFTYTNSLISDLNASLSAIILDNYDLLVQINSTANFILSNVTYTQYYLETTLYPMVNDTSYVVNNIWSKLLGMEQTLNATYELAGQINVTTTNINANVTELVTRSRRMKAWLTN